MKWNYLFQATYVESDQAEHCLGQCMYLRGERYNMYTFLYTDGLEWDCISTEDTAVLQ